MNIAGKTLWQQACGDRNRSYADVCLKWDVILFGPGYCGPFPDGEQVLRRDGWTKNKITNIRVFFQEMSEGDIVVLRQGTTDVFGVGEIVGGYEWSDSFGDVDGWNLQHVRRVRWLWKTLEHPKTFPTHSLKWGATTQRLKPGKVMDWLKQLDVSQADLGQGLVRLPEFDEAPFKIDELAEFLFDNGVASASIENLVKIIDELTIIAKWYTKFDNPSESETVTYLAVPLLRALGWTPQKMAIEWHHVDIALFHSLPRTDENLIVVVEAKRKDNSCLTAVSQAQSYAQSRPSCSKLIVTDGIRYGVYTRTDSGFDLYAYMNLTRLVRNYPIYDCHGVNEAVLAMTPEWTGPKP